MCFIQHFYNQRRYVSLRGKCYFHGLLAKFVVNSGSSTVLKLKLVVLRKKFFFPFCLPFLYITPQLSLYGCLELRDFY